MEGLPKPKAPQARNDLPGDTGSRHAQDGLASRIEECCQVMAHRRNIFYTIQRTPVGEGAVKWALILKP
jgi:hypothetical protein